MATDDKREFLKALVRKDPFATTATYREQLREHFGETMNAGAMNRLIGEERNAIQAVGLRTRANPEQPLPTLSAQSPEPKTDLAWLTDVAAKMKEAGISKIEILADGSPSFTLARQDQA